MFKKENISNTLNWILFVALFATSATYLSEFPIFKNIWISPLIIAIILWMIYANTLRSKLPKEWGTWILFSTKTLLRLAIVFYGFRLTFQNIAEVGFSWILVSFLIVFSTFLIWYFFWTKVLKLDREITILTSAWSAICWAAAVLATEPVLKSKPYKATIAVSTVVLFWTIAMFLYPFLYKIWIIDFNPKEMGIYLWWTLHEVANVVAWWNAIGQETADVAVIVKMIRVMLLAPFLLILWLWISNFLKKDEKNKNKKISLNIPWFAIWFIIIIWFNSFDFLPKNIVWTINNIDTFALTMAMTALWMETNINKFKWVWMKPIYLALILFIWLIFWGYFITKLSMNF